MFFKNTANKLTFNTFLSGTPARDYIMQDTTYDKQIARAVNMIRDADYVLLGAGMSTAAGAQYGGSFFEERFGEFQKIYGKNPYRGEAHNQQ